MTSSLSALCRVVTLIPFLLASQGLPAQQAPSESNEYRPEVGQPGKDVIWVPTSEPLAEQMLRMAGVGPTDYVIDLGSGDGRLVIMAAEKFGARGLGIEYNPDLVSLSKRNAVAAGVADRTSFVQADIFESDFSQATVITMYLLPSLNMRLRPRILDLGPGTRVVSHSFDMGDWEPDEKITWKEQDAYLWIVPADVAGHWTLTFPTEGERERWRLELDQAFQTLSGRVYLANRSFPLMDGRVEGAAFRFYFTDASGSRRDFFGQALGDGGMEGTLRKQDGATVKWSAAREDS